MAEKEKETAVVPVGRVLKEGIVKRRIGRMHQWTSRYFQLYENCLTYKMKQDSTTIRGTFELIPGTIVTDIKEESLVKMKSNKLFSFWVVNPSGNDKGSAMDDKNYESDEEDEKEGEGKTTTTSSAAAATTTAPQQPANRNLQNIVRNELETQKRQKESAEEQVGLHQAHDSNVTQGAMVAAVAVGGVVVGAMTMGIGLIPYFAVVGITAAAAGGAAAFNRSRRPSNSRLIMAFETNKEAAEWKAAIELRIRAVAESRRPMLPDSVDAQTISAILDLGASMGTVWKRVAVHEGMCVLEHITYERRGNAEYKYHPMMNFQDKSPFYAYLMRLVMDPEYMKMCVDTQNRVTDGVTGGTQGRANRVRKAQLSVCCSPVDTFLTLMNNTDNSCWPTKGSFKVVRELDDHADLIAVEIVTDTTQYGGKSANLRRKLCVSRFWQLDDDGVYLVTYSSVKDEAVTPSLTIDDVNKKGKAAVYTEENCDVQFDAVVTIAPRHDAATVAAEIPEAMVTCICQVGLNKGNWQKGEVTALMESFLRDNLLELREALWNNKYSITRNAGGEFSGPHRGKPSVPPITIPGVERAESNEIIMSGDYATSDGKYGAGSPPKSAATSRPVSTTHPSSHTSTRSAAGSGVTTVQPGMDEDAPEVKKKRLGFLQRMKSTSAATHKSPITTHSHATAAHGAGSAITPITASGPDRSPLVRANSAVSSGSAHSGAGGGMFGNSPPGPSGRKHVTSTTINTNTNTNTSSSTAAAVTGAAPRSVSPFAKALARGKPAYPIGSKPGGPDLRCPSSDIADYDDDSDSDCSGQFTRSPPGSPKATTRPTHITPTAGHKATSEPRGASPPASKRRDKKTNAEASKLRNHISMTEYEIQRLQKSLKKRNAHLQALEAHGTATEETQQAVLDYNTEIQALHLQIQKLTARQQAYKDDYFDLTGEPFEPSRGTRGLMERWKGRSLAHKEKDQWDTAAVSAQAQAAASQLAPNAAQNFVRPVVLRHATGDAKPAHWDAIRRADDGGKALTSWLRFNLTALVRSICLDGEGPGGDLAEVTCDNYYATALNKTAHQRASLDAALQDTKAANLALVALVTLSLLVVGVVSSVVAI